MGTEDLMVMTYTRHAWRGTERLTLNSSTSSSCKKAPWKRNKGGHQGRERIRKRTAYNQIKKKTRQRSNIRTCDKQEDDKQIKHRQWETKLRQEERQRTYKATWKERNSRKARQENSHKAREDQQERDIQKWGKTKCSQGVKPLIPSSPSKAPGLDP